MKKFFYVSLIATGLHAQGQVQSGTIAAGGSIGLSTNSSKTEVTTGGNTTTTKGPRYTSVAFLPRLHYFFMDNVAVGAAFGYQVNTSKSTVAAGGPGGGTVEIKNRVGGIVMAPYLRYHYMFNEQFGLFGQAELPLFLGAIKTESTTGGTTTSVKGSQIDVGLAVSPGFVFFPTKNFGLEAKFGNLFGIYRSVERFETGGTKQRDIYTRFDFLNVNTLGFNLGLAYYFN